MAWNKALAKSLFPLSVITNERFIQKLACLLRKLKCVKSYYVFSHLDFEPPKVEGCMGMLGDGNILYFDSYFAVPPVVIAPCVFSRRTMQSTERGKKINAAVNQTGKAVMQTGRAVGVYELILHLQPWNICDFYFNFVSG